MKIRRILAFALALCLIWCAAISAAEKAQTENPAADAAAQVKPENEPGEGTEAGTDPAEPAQPAEEPAQSVEETEQPDEEPEQPAEEPAQPAEEPAQPAEEPAQSVEETEQPDEEPVQPAEEPAQPDEEPVQPAEEPAQPAEGPEEPAEAPTQPAEESVQPDGEPETPGEELVQSAEEPEEPAKEPALPAEEEPAQPETVVQLPLPTEGSVTPGESVTCTLADGSEEKVWELALSYASELILTTEGLPVRVTILSVPDGETRLDETASDGEGLAKDIRLLQGTYLVCICSAKEYGGEFTWKMERQDETGTEPEISEDSEPVDGAKDDADNTEAEPEAGENAEPAGFEATEQAETEPSGANPDFTAETNPDEVSGDDGDAATEQAEIPAVSVRLHSNLQNGEETVPGTEVVIRAEVTGTDRPFRLQWQYSPDGGKTVVNVEEDNGNENRYLRYILDETNIHYLWRAAVVFDEPEE